MRTIPVDLILSSLADLLREHPDDTAPGIYAHQIACCIDFRAVAEQWTHRSGTERHAQWLFHNLDAANPDARAVCSAETRSIEVAVARRLADTAFALTIEQTPAITAQATTLLRAACAVVGLMVADDPRVLPMLQREVDARDDLNDRAQVAEGERDIVVQERDMALATIGEIATALRNPGTTNIVEHARHVYAMAQVAPASDLKRDVDATQQANTALRTDLTRFESLIKSIRTALGAGSSDDIVQHARTIKALSQQAARAMASPVRTQEECDQNRDDADKSGRMLADIRQVLGVLPDADLVAAVREINAHAKATIEAEEERDRFQASFLELQEERERLRGELRSLYRAVGGD
jgi:hypothetical protein